MIPKIIHFCWFGGKEKPVDVQRYIASWKKFCPDYEIKEWNEETFDVSQNDYCREAYEAKKWAFVTDYVRLKVLYDYGGIYMDSDVEVVKPLDPLLTYNGLSGYESQTSIPTGTMGACRENEWIGILLRDYDNRHFLKPDGSYDLTTNVIAITNLTVSHYGLDLHGQKLTFGDGCVLLPFDYLCAKNWKSGQVVRTENTYTIHHFSGSWLEKQEQERRDLFRKYFNVYRTYTSERLARQLANLTICYQQQGVIEVIKKIWHHYTK